jgi:phosphatidylethanolamine-binding protein (PEBP) family uncharacterized protein
MFALTSPDHMDGAEFKPEYVCTGGSLGTGVNPELDWMGVPAGTKSFAIIFFDKTATGDLGQHWGAWDIPASIMKLPKGVDKALTGVGGKQTNAFLAPCPTSNDDYEFRLYALNTDMAKVPTAVKTGTAVANTGAVKALNTYLETDPDKVVLGKAVLKGTCKAQMGGMGN